MAKKIDRSFRTIQIAEMSSIRLRMPWAGRRGRVLRRLLRPVLSALT
jgi:hypothetical protein